MATQSLPGEYRATCEDCNFHAAGFEAYCHRKAAAHAREHGHKLTIGLNGAHK